jgi:hypothetical protein
VVAALQKQGMAALHKHDLPAAHQSLDQLRQLAPGDLAVVELEKAVSAVEPAPAPVEATPTETAAAETPAPAEKHAAVAKPVKKPVHLAGSTDDPLRRLQVRGMLVNADQALSDGDSATAALGYQQVLQLEPGNAEARAGLRKARGQ